MEGMYRTIYKTSYGEVKADFRFPHTLEAAEKIGRDYCKNIGAEYVRTEEVENV